MAVSSCSCLCLVTMLSVLTFSEASYFHVGGSDGWSSSKNVNYTKWADSIHFQVDDVLVFVYDNKSENVLMVSPNNFKSCNLTYPSHKWTSGKDQVHLHTPGMYYFVSSLDGKCEGKAKVSLMVYDQNDHDVPSSATPVVPAPAPKQSSAATAEVSVLVLGLGLLFLFV